MEPATPHSLPDRSREQTAPTTAVPFDVPRDSENPYSTKEPAAEPSWQPRLDRRQSWSDQDRKHELQERLLDMEAGRELGFSEKHEGKPE
ncbi:hypothetical protein N7468_003374 [Penicillium chermesinum]|uniref:Uncharacterized protein n=1 Tax=Penicillium chermesinum TaxID=63820 RepID=A0A9W9P6W9_9EURO|nr:uncharacterized protein N7468_003374 [Penicillium chermesinum]KAJ5238755.1 hypothetical protein N7468_003374 [Penicillium chermesinum]